MPAYAATEITGADCAERAVVVSAVDGVLLTLIDCEGRAVEVHFTKTAIGYLVTAIHDHQDRE